MGKRAYFMRHVLFRDHEHICTWRLCGERRYTEGTGAVTERRRTGNGQKLSRSGSRK